MKLLASKEDTSQLTKPDFDKGRKQLNASLPDLSRPLAQSFASSQNDASTAASGDDALIFDSQKASEFFNIILDKGKEFQESAVKKSQELAEETSKRKSEISEKLG